MACEDQINTEDLINAKTDAVTLGEVATSRAGAVEGGSPITTSTNRFGEVTDTVKGRLDKLGVIFDDPIRDWSASLLVSDLRAHRYPATTGDVYIPTKPLPFTTGVTFNTDDWVVLQGITSDELINDLSQAYEFATVAEYKVFTTSFPLGKVINLLDRDAQFTIISGTGAADNFGTIASSMVSQSVKVTTSGLYNVRAYGAIGDWNGSNGTDSTLAIQACIDAVNIQGTVVIDAEYMYSVPLTTKANTIYKIIGGGLLATDVNAGAATAADTFNLTNSDVWIDNVRFKNNDRDVVGGYTVINIVSGSNYKVTNCNFNANASADVGIKPGVTDIVVSNNYFKPKFNPDAFCITLNGVITGQINGNTINECDAGIVLLGGSKFITIHGNTITDCHEVGIDIYASEDVTTSGNIISNCQLQGLKIGLDVTGNDPTALTYRVVSIGDVFNDCGLAGAGAIKINSNDSIVAGDHKIISPIIRCPSGLTISAIGCSAVNCEVISPTITGPHLIGINVNDRAINFKLRGGTIRDSKETGIKLNTLAGSPINGDPRMEITGVSVDAPGAASDGVCMTIANAGASIISNNTFSFGANTEWGFRFGGGHQGLVMQNNRVVGTTTITDAYSASSPSILDTVVWSGNKMGVDQVDTLSGLATIPDGASTVSISFDLISAPLITSGSRGNEFVWINSISPTNLTLQRTGTSGILLIHYQGELVRQ